MKAEAVRTWRKNMRMTQQQAAEKLGVAKRTYQAWEAKGTDTLADLAIEALTVRAAWPQAAEGVAVISRLVHRSQV